MNAEALSPLRRSIILGVCLVVLVFGWLSWRDISSRPRRPSELPLPEIDKQPVAFATRTFDPAAPPSDMPRLAPGEEGECDSNFLSNASVSGEPRQADATHGTVTITHIKVTLQLAITIWVPAGASARVTEHEEGHRQISEFYYQTADKLAQRIAANYMGRQFDITGSDLGAESNRTLQQVADEIDDEYNNELDPRPTQLLYDSITDHSRNNVVVKDAVSSALKNVTIALAQPQTVRGNSLSIPVRRRSLSGSKRVTPA